MYSINVWLITGYIGCLSGDHDVPELPSGCIWHNIFTPIRWPCMYQTAAIWLYLTQYIQPYQVTMYVPELPSGCIWHNIFTPIRWPCTRAAIMATSCHLAVSDTIYSTISGDHDVPDLPSGCIWHNIFNSYQVTSDVPELPSGCIWHNIFNHIRWPWCTRAAIYGLYLTQYINNVRWPWCTRAAIWLYLTQYIQPYQVTIMYQTCHLAVSGTIYSLISADHDVLELPSGCIWQNIFNHIRWPWCTRSFVSATQIPRHDFD